MKVEIADIEFTFTDAEDGLFNISADYDDYVYSGNSFLKPIGPHGIEKVQELVDYVGEDIKVETKDPLMISIEIAVPFTKDNILILLKREELTNEQVMLREIAKLSKKIKEVELINTKFVEAVASDMRDKLDELEAKKYEWWLFKPNACSKLNCVFKSRAHTLQYIQDGIKHATNLTSELEYKIHKVNNRKNLDELVTLVQTLDIPVQTLDIPVVYSDILKWLTINKFRITEYIQSNSGLTLKYVKDKKFTSVEYNLLVVQLNLTYKEIVLKSNYSDVSMQYFIGYKY